MATAIQCYFNKIKLFKSLTNKLYIYNCANIISDCHNNFHSHREISTKNDLLSGNLPLEPSFRCNNINKNNNRRLSCHHNNHINQQLHWTIKNSIINGATITSSQQRLGLLQNLNLTQYQLKKSYCSSTNNDKKSKRLPELMEFPKIVWPSIIKSVKNWILVNLIIRPYFDKEFTISDFATGTRHALQVVSQSMANGELSTLNGMVAEEAITELQQSVSKLSVAQRNEVCVNKDDVYLAFPYQIGIMFDETNEEIQKRWVEITMVFHVLRGLNEMRERGDTIPLNVGVLPEYRDKISICNYRFIKEFTQGSESDWTINVINHFKPADFIENED